MPRSRLVFVLALLGLLACSKKEETPKTLPDSFAVEVKILSAVDNDAGDKANEARVFALEGRPLVFKGKVIGTLKKSYDSVEVDTTIAKADWAAMHGEGWAVRFDGACGADDVALDASAGKDDEASLAESLALSKSLTIYTHLQGPTAPKVVVDFGSTTEIAIGTLTLKKGDSPVFDVPIDNCKSAPNVVVGGANVGTFATDKRVQLVSAEDKVCYALNDVAYGAYGGSGNRAHFKGQRVYALDEVPSYAFVPAPDKIAIDGIATTMSELVREPCAKK
ncbi:MAG TPA: hypothetical protein VF407_14280 [Polyangiaceae bacterium]